MPFLAHSIFGMTGHMSRFLHLSHHTEDCSDLAKRVQLRVVLVLLFSRCGGLGHCVCVGEGGLFQGYS